MNPKTLLVYTIVGCLTAGCSKPDSKKSANSPGAPQGVVCSLEGAFSRCSDNGNGTSLLVRLQSAGSNLHETIEEFANNNTCSGMADNLMAFNAVVNLGDAGASEFVVGGTDVEITPDVDLAGCGAGQPMYTVIKFDDECTQFQTPSQPPGCSPEDRGTVVDPQPFVKE